MSSQLPVATADVQAGGSRTILESEADFYDALVRAPDPAADWDNCADGWHEQTTAQRSPDTGAALRRSIRLRRPAAPLALASALVLAALAHGTVAEIRSPADRIPSGSVSTLPTSLEGAWRRLPSPYSDVASADVTPKSAVELLDAVASTESTAADRAPTMADQADDRFLPMAFDAICALPVLEGAIRTAWTEPTELEARIAGAPLQPAALAFDVRTIAVAWPMLEPWSRRPDEPVGYVASALAKGAMKSIQVAATAAAKSLPARPEPPQEQPAQKPKAKPVAALPTPAPAQPATVDRTFESVAREAP